MKHLRDFALALLVIEALAVGYFENRSVQDRLTHPEPPRTWSCMEAVSCPHVDWRFNRMEDVCVYDEIIKVSPTQPAEHCYEIRETGV